MKNLMKYFHDNGELVSIYSNKKDSEKFSVSMIESYDERYVFCSCYDLEGKPDGYEIKLIRNIFLIESGGEYLNEMSNSISKQENPIRIFGDSDHLLRVLRLSRDEKKCLSIELIDSGNFDAKGIVTNVIGEMVIFQNYSPEGKPDCTAYFHRESITNLTISSQIDLELQKQIHE